ncbi:phage-associated protein-like protein, partial [mine drainage metagenome]
MASADDVAAAILEVSGRVDTFKLQKLAYYCQAWHLVWVGQPLFPEPIQAWAGGPVVPTLYERHRGRYSVSDWPEGDSNNLAESERGTVFSVVNAYKKLSGRQLSQ